MHVTYAPSLAILTVDSVLKHFSFACMVILICLLLCSTVDLATLFNDYCGCLGHTKYSDDDDDDDDDVTAIMHFLHLVLCASLSLFSFLTHVCYVIYSIGQSILKIILLAHSVANNLLEHGPRNPEF